MVVSKFFSVMLLAVLGLGGLGAADAVFAAGTTSEETGQTAPAPAKSTFKISTDKTVLFHDGTGFRLFINLTTPRPVTGADLDYTVLNKDFSVGSVGFSNPAEYTYQWVIPLVPNRAGVIKIPAMPVGASGDLLTPKFEIKVKQAEGLRAKNFIKAQLRAQNPIKNQLAMYRVEVDNLPQVKITTYTPPQGEGVHFELFAERTVSRASAGNRFYKTTIREYKAIFRQEGKITINPPSISGYVITGNGQSPFNQGAKPVTVTVGPNPENLIVSDNLSISVKWNPAEENIHVGDPITRTVTYIATNNSLSQLPRVPVPDFNENDFDYYEDVTVETEQLMRDKKLKSTRVVKQVFVPLRNHTKFVANQSVVEWKNPNDGKVNSIVVLGANYEINGFSFSDYIPRDPKTAYKIFAGIIAGFVLIIFLVYSVIMYRRRSGIYGWLHLRADYMGYWRNFARSWKKDDPIKCRAAILEWAQKRWPDKTIVGLTGLPFYSKAKNEIDNLSRACWSKDPEAAKWDGKKLYSLISKNKNYKKPKAKRGINPYGLNGEIYETVQQTLK